MLTTEAAPTPRPIETIHLDDVRIDPSWSLRLLPALAMRRRVLPLCKLNERVLVACTTTPDATTIHMLRKSLQAEITPVLVDSSALMRAMRKAYGNLESAKDVGESSSALSASSAMSTDRGIDGSSHGSAEQICNEILRAASLRNASDIHIVPEAEKLRVQFRVDGFLEEYRPLAMDAHAGLINRIKVLAGMDIAEKRSPQDGRFSLAASPGISKMDIRAASLPTRFGERITLRLLCADRSALSLERLGMESDDYQTFRNQCEMPHGLVLLTGPTGCGKSTTLYAAMDYLVEKRAGNIITVEDPVEYEMSGISQVEVDSRDKVNFGKALRSLLRHDPDVVMIGEIRDQETADIAIQASLTGHLVFSTLHTNDAVGVVSRLVEMGVQPYLLAATLRLAIAQRLVRRLCDHCKSPRATTAQEVELFHRPELENATVFEPRGCVYCAGKGYVGRIAIFELMPVHDTIAECIARSAAETDIRQYLYSIANKSLADDAIQKLIRGITSMDDARSAILARG